MKIIQIFIQKCHRCKRGFVPKIDILHKTVIIPEACPKRDCRSKTWNIPDNELQIIKEKQMQNLALGGYRASIHVRKVPIFDKYKPKKKEIRNISVCLICELFFAMMRDKKHHQRRHNGLCYTCNSSNQIIRLKNGRPICQPCFEDKNG